MAENPAVAIVGAGPCGVAAAIQLKRHGLESLLFERRAVGGLLLNANRVENYPGIPPGISGPLLSRLLERHLEAAGVEPVFDEITGIEWREGRYQLRSRSGASHSVEAVLLATGTRPRKGMISGGGKMFYEVWDVLTEEPGKRAAIVGGGDAAYDYALNLASKSFEVTLLRRGERRCLPLLAERVEEFSNITVMRKTMVESCLDKGDGLEITITREGAKSTILADFLLVACGRDAEDGLLRSQPSDAPPDGLFTGGDVVRGDYRQAGIAVGDGLHAAMAIARYINRDGEWS
jgi:thioredoxin reductase